MIKTDRCPGHTFGEGKGVAAASSQAFLIT
jgi:hypothetical protein